MTIDEAIKQCLEVADDLTKQADTADDAMILDGFNVDDCRQYIASLRQLAEWLSELKEAKQLLKVAVNDIQDILHYANSISVCFHCVHRIDTCYGHPACKDRAKWEHLEEALKLIGEDKEE